MCRSFFIMIRERHKYEKISFTATMVTAAVIIVIFFFEEKTNDCVYEI